MSEVLDLSSIFDRDTVRLPDGSSCELRNPQELGILDEHRLRALIERIQKLHEQPAKSEEDAEQASRMLRELAAMLVVDNGDEYAPLPDWACASIFRFWTSRATPEETGNPPKPRRRPTTAASAPGSKRSTAATRKTGSTSRRGR